MILLGSERVPDEDPYSLTLAFNALLGDGPRAVTSEPRKPFWLFPNLLSLDAPLVAVAWLAIFAKTWRVSYHPWEAYVALGLGVWVIYVVDRLIDASLRKNDPARCEARHLFHWKHRKLFATGAALASLVALVLVIVYMPVTIFAYLIFAGLMIGAFFGMSLLSGQNGDDIPYAKNILAGLVFAYGTGLAAYVYMPSTAQNGFQLIVEVIVKMMGSRELISFAVLCILNISAIDLWEHAHRSNDIETKAGDELALTLPLALLGGAAILFAYQATPHPDDGADYGVVTRSFFYAILTGAGLLHVLNRSRARFRTDSLRVLADVALLIPVIVFFVFSSFPSE